MGPVAGKLQARFQAGSVDDVGAAAALLDAATSAAAATPMVARRNDAGSTSSLRDRVAVPEEGNRPAEDVVTG